MVKFTLLLLAIQLAGSLGRAVDDPDNRAAVKAVARDGFSFAKDFYQTTARKQPGNYISSPISLSTILAMVTYGARGTTETALKSGLHFNNDDNIQKKGLKTLTEELNESPHVELRLANKIFLADGVEVKPEYQQLAEDIFGSSVEKVDFSKTDDAVETINSWCAQQTNSKIKNVVSSDSLDAGTQAVLVNAAYFKGKWKTMFSKDDTHDDTFHLEDGTTKNVSTMHAQQKYNYGVMDDAKAKFAELPYQGDEVSMFIIVPDEIDGLKNLEDNFLKINFQRLFTEGSETELELSLPKFEIETKIDLQEPLKELRMGEIFEDTADFSGMFNNPMRINQAIQKAYIKVDEEGTEAAAVTEMEFTRSMLPEPSQPVEFRADRPFCYAIVKRVGGEDGSAAVLFQGHYKGN